MTNIGIGIGVGLGGAPSTGPLDPRKVAQLMAGAIWLPGIGVTTPSGNLVVASQATQTNTLTTAGVTEHIPVQGYSSNGAPVWQFGEYKALRVISPGSALQWTQRGSYALWIRGAALSGAPQQILGTWPEGASPNNRIYAQLTDGDNTRFNVQGSINGLSGDVLDYSAPDNRWKYNSGAGYDFTTWHFLRWSFDYTGGANYDGPAGENLSTKLRVYVDEIYDEGLGFSAPHDGPLPAQKYGDPSTGGPIRAPLFATSYRFTVGSSDTLGGSWRGWIGPVYVADETAGRISSAQWKRIMQFRAPA